MDTREMFGKLTNARGDGGRGGGVICKGLVSPSREEWSGSALSGFLL